VLARILSISDCVAAATLAPSSGDAGAAVDACGSGYDQLSVSRRLDGKLRIRFSGLGLALDSVRSPPVEAALPMERHPR
jgi:hypothetical protein